jgi:hypothetical protein
MGYLSGEVDLVRHGAWIWVKNEIVYVLNEVRAIADHLFFLNSPTVWFSLWLLTRWLFFRWHNKR